jgi:hypothetical protein
MTDLAAGQGWALEDCFANSESATDVPMLAAVGHPHAVNPDRGLRREALARGWPILQFRHPVPLRTRVGRGGRPAVVEIASAAVVAAAARWHYFGHRPSSRVRGRRAG